MRYGCNKLCPKVRENLQKAREARERGDVEELSSDGRPDGVAGPSGLAQSVKSSSARGSKESSRHHAGIQSPRRTKTTPKDDSEDCCDDPTTNGAKNGTGSHSGRPGRQDGRNGKRQSEAHKAGTSGGADEVPSHLHSIKSMKNAKQREERGGSSRKTRTGKGTIKDFENHKNCHAGCPGIDERLEKLGNEKEQELLDEYIINKALPYFVDLCNCNYSCLVNQLWKNPFISSTIAAAGIFALGVKLCSELDGWTISNTF